MDTSKNLISLVLFSMVAFTFSIDTTFEIIEQPAVWFEFGEPAVVKCQWKHSQPDATPQVVAWKAKNFGIRKITRDDVNASFIYETSPIPEDRQSELTEWDGSVSDEGVIVQTSRLTILEYGVNDPENYTCEVDIGQAQKSRIIGIRGFQTPTIIMVDVVTEVDLRAPEEEEQVNATTAVNATYTDTGEPEPENNDGDGMTDSVADGDAQPSSRKRRDTEDKKIEVQCIIEDAYPKPSKVEFVVGEAANYAPTSVEWEQDPITKLFTGTATLELDADASLDGKQVTCKSWLPSDPIQETTSMNGSSVIEVQHDMSWVTTTISPGVANAGDTVQIQCNSDGNPRPSFFVSTDLSEKPDFETTDNRAFNIPSVTKEQSGSYWCVAVMNVGSDPSDQYQLESENKPTLDVQYIEDPTLSEAGNIVLNKGQSKTVDCYFNGNPEMEPVWKKDGVKINTVGGRLDITNAQYDDKAEYTCETTNNVDTRKKSVDIQVHGACEAKFKTPLNIGGSPKEAGKYYVKLECEVTGVPACTVSISSSDNFDVSEAGGVAKENGKVLEFEKMSKLTAPVSFFCIASNNVVSTYANVSVTLDDSTDVCCEEISTGGLSTGAIIGIILLVLVILVGIPVACYFVRKRNAQPKEKASSDPEAAEAEKESLHKEASSERPEEP